MYNYDEVVSETGRMDKNNLDEVDSETGRMVGWKDGRIVGW